MSEPNEKERINGSVVWWNDIRGFGFLKPDNMKMDVFVHYSAIERADPDERRTLEAGQRVEFELNKRNGKVQAERVVALEV